MVPLHDGQVVACGVTASVGQRHFDRWVKAGACGLDGPCRNAKRCAACGWGHREFVCGHRADDDGANPAAIREGDAIGFDLHGEALQAGNFEDDIFAATHHLDAVGTGGQRGQVNGVGDGVVAAFDDVGCLRLY